MEFNIYQNKVEIEKIKKRIDARILTSKIAKRIKEEEPI